MIVNAVVRMEVPEGTSPDEAARVIQGVLTLAQDKGVFPTDEECLPVGYRVDTAFALSTDPDVAPYMDLVPYEPPEVPE